MIVRPDGAFLLRHPAHFIAEGVDQTRGWFYTLLVLSTALFDRPAFDNVIVNGTMANGAVLSSHVGTIPYAGSGYRMELYGTEGTLIASGPDSPQLSDIVLHGAKGNDTLEALPDRKSTV